MTIGERIRELRQRSGLSMQEVAERLNTTKQTVYKYETGIITNIPSDRISAMAVMFGVSPAVIMGWQRQGDLPTGGFHGGRIPVLGSIRAGLPQTAAENIIDYEEIPAEMERDGEYFALQIRGDSMEPRMRTGDVIIVRKQETVDNGDVAVVLINGDEATVKRYYRRESGVSLVAINPAYEPLFYTPEQVEELPVRVMGKVVELRAKF